MARVSFFIDGFNIYHALADRLPPSFKWLNLKALAEMYLRRQDVLSNVFYFTSLVPWDAEKAGRHKIYIKALESFDVTLIYGQFRKVQKRCRTCKQLYDTFEEKETDVNIAIKLYEQAVANTYDTAIIVSGDSDLAPVIRVIKKAFTNKKIGVLIPFGGKADVLKGEAHFYHKIDRKHLSASRLPESLAFLDGSRVDCPNSWKL